VWLRLFSCAQHIERDVRTRLREEFDTTLPRFDLMAQLEREPAGMKMNALSRRLMVTNGNVTGITDQLEREGWVERVDMPSDRRAYLVKLTPAGRALFARMAAAHEAWIVQAFSTLNPRQTAQLHSLLGQLKAPFKADVELDSAHRTETA
jgi:DNA-binding MarR family transcriptional regulator